MIKIRTRKSNAIHQWMMKEYGSWEDHNYDPGHACAILQKFGKTLSLTENDVKALIISGKYQGTAWHDDEIDGGELTKRTIMRWVNTLTVELIHSI